MDITSRRFTIFIHLIFWTVYFLVNGASYTRFVGLPDVYLKILLTGAVHMALAFINLLVLLPVFFLRRKFAIYLLIMTPMFMGTVALLMFIEKNWFLRHGDIGEVFSWANFFTAFISTFIVMTMTALLKFLQEWYKQQERNRELAISQLMAEHKMLRMQVNPHFLFNALNNIYSLSYKKSESTGPAILKLAELMRYLLYDSESQKVPLQTEVDYIKNYIGLQQLKYGNTDKIRFQTENISSVLIDPLLFIPFVENAFKHGNLAEPDAFIEIFISLNALTLNFRVSNSYDANDLAKDSVGGVGVENVKSRLRAYYPNMYKLEINNDGRVYSVHLEINL
jgi:sensor histidine kinase YesM